MKRPRTGARAYPAFAGQRRRPGPPPQTGTGLARVLSKLGFCSRSQGAALAADGRVRVNGVVRRDPEWRVAPALDRIEVDGIPIRAAAKTYVMLNKPRRLVTTATDEQGRSTVFACFAQAQLPFLSPVGRLDMASEGLLLFTNDTAWAARITDPATRIEKTYHVQVNCLADDALMRQMQQGVGVDGDFLAARKVTLLRHGSRTSWLEVRLDEGKNRHLRRLLSALGAEVLRLVRVAIGPLPLGDLPKGQFRHLTPAEVHALAQARQAPDTLGSRPS